MRRRGRKSDPRVAGREVWAPARRLALHCLEGILLRAQREGAVLDMDRDVCFFRSLGQTVPLSDTSRGHYAIPMFNDVKGPLELQSQPEELAAECLTVDAEAKVREYDIDMLESKHADHGAASSPQEGAPCNPCSIALHSCQDVERSSGHGASRLGEVQQRDCGGHNRGATMLDKHPDAASDAKNFEAMVAQAMAVRKHNGKLDLATIYEINKNDIAWLRTDTKAETMSEGLLRPRTYTAQRDVNMYSRLAGAKAMNETEKLVETSGPISVGPPLAQIASRGMSWISRRPQQAAHGSASGSRSSRLLAGRSSPRRCWRSSSARRRSSATGANETWTRWPCWSKRR